MKALKILLLAVAGAVAALVIVIAIVIIRFDPERYKPELSALVKEKTGRTLTMEGPLSLSFFPKLGVKADQVRLSERNSQDVFARIGQLHLSLAFLPLLRQRFVVDRINLAGLSATVIRGPDGKTNIDDLMGEKRPDRKPEAPSTPIALDIAGVDVQADRFLWRDLREGSQWQLSEVKLATGRIADDVPGKLSLSARVEANQPKLRGGLNLSSDYRFNLAEQRAALTGLSLKFTGEPGVAKALQLALDGRVDFAWGARHIAGELTAKVDESTVRGKFEIKGAAPAQITFDASADRLNLDRFQSGSTEGKAAAGSGGKAAPSKEAEQPIELDALKKLNLKGQLSVGQLTAAGMQMQKVNVALRAANGQLNLDPMSAELYGGLLRGSTGVNAHQNRFTVRHQLSGISIGPLLQDAMKKDLLEGRGNLTVDVQGTGRTVSALKRSLSGSARVELKDGAIKGINLAEALRKAKAAMGSKSAQEQAMAGGDKTDFTELSASFAIRNGVAHNDDLDAKSPFLRLGGAGDIDIGAGRIAYVAKASVVATSAGQGGKELESLRGLTVPVRISGPRNELSYRVDVGAMAGEAVKSKIEQGVKDRLGGAMKGLFGR